MREEENRMVVVEDLVVVLLDDRWDPDGSTPFLAGDDDDCYAAIDLSGLPPSYSAMMEK